MFKTVTSRAARQCFRPQTAQAACIGRRYAHAPEPFDWKDPLGANKNLFTEEEMAIAETAEQYCQERMLPRVLGVRAFVSRQSRSCTNEYIQRPTGKKSTTS